MGSGGNKQLKGGHIIPPGELLVQRFTESRAPELESLYSTIASRLNNDFRSQRNKRRRTTGYDNRASKTRFRKKQKTGVLSGESSKKCVLHKKALTLPRHIRRRRELNENPESGFCTSGDGTKRLRTHVWHAKRFTMTKRWGFHLPLGFHGRGRGSRALLKLLKNGTIVHDASYYCAVQLEGLQDSLLLILSTIMSPFPSSDAENVLSGDIYATSMLHHAGAPNLGTIAPVIYMWRPVQQSTDAGSDQIRQLWIWIHAAALTQGFNILQHACESQGKVDEDFASVRCTLLEGQFGTLEVIGAKASHLLQKILHPVSSETEKSLSLKICSFMGADEERISCSGIIPLTVSDPRAVLTYESTVIDSSNTDLWDVGKRLCCPIAEKVVCMEKHHQRLSSFCLTDKTSDDLDDSTKMNTSRFCPILLLRRNNNLKDSITRWSLILPLSWVKAFWVPLVSAGAQAIGLRERSWVACEAGIPSYPSEFPECDSYFSLKEAEFAATDEEAALRPPSVRPLSIPVPPPWNYVRLMNPTDTQNTQICCSESVAFADNDMVVARTSSMLASFINSLNGEHFPDKNTTCETEIIKDGKILDQVPDTVNFLANRCRKVCFVRVILHAYKEGVIEDGAVVCAPRLADIKLWISGCSSNKGELQVPQSSMAAYFVKQDSGKWEFQVPNDNAAKEFNRWPIGFVTTGFVRGSKKPSARALCDAVLLAHLRQEQRNCVPLKRRMKEIYVLTRNLRSTAYRLALVSIVLEHQQEDLDHF